MSDKLYNTVASRAQHRCEYCHSPEEPCGYKFHVEHIIPQSKGGSNELSNLALCCAPCNLHKSNKIEKDGVRFFHPRRDSWSVHFSWNEDYHKTLRRWCSHFNFRQNRNWKSYDFCFKYEQPQVGKSP